MAFLNEVGKAIGKASQGISDAAQTISEAAQETRETIARERQEKATEKEAKRLAEQEKAAKEAKKCPQCGQPLNGIVAKCPACGYEFHNLRAADSIVSLTKEIEKLERKRNNIKDAVASRISKSTENPTDEKIASLIRNFIVPNTKEDIFEFMILASSYMNARFLAGKTLITDVAPVVIKAWETKFYQTYEKAKLSFGNDPDFKKIQGIFDKKMAEIEAEKPIKKKFPFF
ncbi:hypothetical protein [Butyrivibrio sp. MC2021]|uniref:hypothetical protein n=1 Tax=Butyrivibrio sp. MC2021 TaxID=1408306 RepID=UPI000685AD1E|nr:hypothetical protein [Butyrivibrio sp. MC2021]